MPKNKYKFYKRLKTILYICPVERKKMIDNEMITEAQPERWLPIPGYEGLYEVSSLGRVRSCERLIIGSDGRRRVFPSRIRKLITYNEYVYVSLLVNQKEKRHLVHRLVAEAFIPNPDKKECVDHLNTKRDDNRACNLAWVSHAENQKNPITAQRLKWRVRQVVRISPDGSTKEYQQINDVELDNFDSGSVCSCCKRGGGFHKGFVWVYKGSEVRDYQSYLEDKNTRIREGYDKRKKPFIAYNDNEEILFSQQKEAVEMGFDSRAIGACIKNGGTHKGYHWRWM